MYLIDTDYVINLLKGRKEAITFFQSIGFTEELYISIITVAEVLEGIYNYKDSKSLKVFQDLLDEEFTILNIDLEVVKNYALLHGVLRKRGNLLDKFDLLIASTCLAYDQTLVTGNVKHFSRIPNLNIYKS